MASIEVYEGSTSATRGVRQRFLALIDCTMQHPFVFDNETSQPIFHDFGDRASIERDHGRAAGHCFNQHQAERFGPGDRRQQRDGTAEEARLFAVVDLADILDVRGVSSLRISDSK